MKIVSLLIVLLLITKTSLAFNFKDLGDAIQKDLGGALGTLEKSLIQKPDSTGTLNDSKSKKPSPRTIKKPSPRTTKKPSPRTTKRNTRASSPKTSNDEKILGSRYEQYIFIKECNLISTRYIRRNELKTAKSKIASIQKYYKKKNKRMNTDTVWESASNNWEKDYRASFRMFKSSGRWNKDLNGLCRIQFMGLSSVEIPGAKKKKRKRDF